MSADAQFHDGQHRERIEQSLRESEARYRSALKAGRMGSWETDLVAHTRTWTSEGMELFGLNLAEGRGHVGGDADEYLLAIHPEDRPIARRLHELADHHDSFPAEYRIVRPDGTTLWLAGRGLVVSRRADGRAHRLISIMADVTERRQAEEQLHIERERLALALQAGQMGAYDYDIVRDVLWWSPQTYAIFGVTPETFFPTRASVTALMHPEDLPAFLKERAEAIENHRPLLLECRVIRPSGTIIWIGHRGQTQYDAAGRAIRHFGITMDITERRHAEQNLHDADRQKDHFIATLAHELRNPLAPIRNAVTLMRRPNATEAQIAWCRDVIDRQVGQMSHLLDDLLDLSRMTSGRLSLRLEPLSLATIVERAIEIAQPLISAASHTLIVELPDEPVTLTGDLTRLAQVFSNLLINAAKYTQSNGRITLNATHAADEVRVTVTDTGIGIAPEQIGHIFEMFGQVESALNRSQGGLGIGLSLAKRLVEMHGGQISARSEGAGRGSEFEVRLPVTNSSDSVGDRQVQFVVDRGAARSARSLKILIADDLHDSADSLAMELRSMGHDVQVVYDGEGALAAGESFAPDVAILDLGMPKLNGYETCRRIRQSPWGQRMTLVAQTGWGQDADRDRTRGAGFDHHLVKPIEAAALAALLDQIDSIDPTNATSSIPIDPR
jgi:PAS domain S-box-containing protein